MPEVGFDIGRQLSDPVEAPQTVPHMNECPRHPPTCTAPEDDGDIALQDRGIAEYEARVQAHVVPEAGYRDPDLVATTDAGLLRGARHGYLLHPDRVSQPTRLAADATDSPWARHQQRAHRLTNSQPQLTSATRYGVHDRVREPLGTGTAWQPAPQPAPQGSMEMPDSPSEEEDTDEGFVGYPPLPREIKPQPIPRCYVEPNRGGERLFQIDQYELPHQATPEGVPPLRHAFFDHVKELADFYRWNGRETYRQARAHPRGTVLAYAKQAPFQPRSWEELKALHLKRFQPMH